ncbi:MAG: hypothetical protein ABWW65_07260 [Thermoprotei archaeon]
MTMKKLSPSEPRASIYITLDFPPRIPATKYERLARRIPYTRTSFLTPYTLELQLLANINELENVISKLIKYISSLPGEIVVCIEYWFTFPLITCPCSKDLVCIDEFRDKTLYIYCNIKEKYFSLRFFRVKPVTPIDPFTVTRSAFKYCDMPINLTKILEHIVTHAEIATNYMKERVKKN